jgi:hypothetical protein
MPLERTLVLVARDRLPAAELARVRELGARGAAVVGWQHPPLVQERFPSPDVAAWLEAAGVPSRTLAAALGVRENIETDEAVIAWMKNFGRARLGPGGSFREIFRYRKLSLWWWAELFLYHDTPLRLYLRDIEALSRLLERERPDRLVLVAPVRDLTRAARKLAPRVDVYGATAPPHRSARTTWRFALGFLKMLGTAAKSLIRRSASRSPVRYLLLTHASMWRPVSDLGEGAERLAELYLDPILTALRAAGESVRAVAVGPPVPFRKRHGAEVLREILELDGAKAPYVPIREYFSPRLVPALARAQASCFRQWREFRSLPQLDEALSHRGVRLGKAALACFRDTFLLQLPWAIRSYHEIRTALARENPSLLVLYAESSGLGRAAIAAATEAGIPSFAVQHGIMYPRYYSHEHAPDEVPPRAEDPCPLPTRTAVFGSLARDLLVERGHYPPESIVVTGSPKFDALLASAERFERSRTRKRLGVPEDASLLVVASRFSAIGPVFTDLVRAAAADPSCFLVVKPHQAERPEPYSRAVERVGAGRVRVLAAEENLLELLFASDGLVTVDSLASSEALVLGRPVLVVNLPSNLTPLVERGVALGARGGEEIGRQLDRFLHDREVQRRLSERRREYIREFAFGADGRSTERILAALRETAEGRLGS